jgi:hypothetical protein
MDLNKPAKKLKEDTNREWSRYSNRRVLSSYFKGVYLLIYLIIVSEKSMIYCFFYKLMKKKFLMWLVINISKCPLYKLLRTFLGIKDSSLDKFPIYIGIKVSFLDEWPLFILYEGFICVIQAF